MRHFALKDILDEAKTWPEADQAELAEAAREIASRRTDIYRVSPEEWEAIQEGLAQADRGEFVSDEKLAESDARHGVNVTVKRPTKNRCIHFG